MRGTNKPYDIVQDVDVCKVGDKVCVDEDNNDNLLCSVEQENENNVKLSEPSVCTEVSLE